MLKIESIIFGIKKVAIFTLPLILLLLFASLWLDRQPKEEPLALPSALAGQFPDKDLVVKVVRLAVLPNEIPTVHKLEAKDLNSQQAFWKQAKPGQWLLVFANAGKAVIYDQEQDRIVRYDRWTGKELGLPSLPKIELRNGSSELGKAATLADKLQSDQWLVSDVRPAANQDYQFSQIFFLTEAGKALTKQLETLVVASSSQPWPKTEEKTTADVVIIVGSQ